MVEKEEGEGFVLRCFEEQPTGRGVGACRGTEAFVKTEIKRDPRDRPAGSKEKKKRRMSGRELRIAGEKKKRRLFAGNIL